MRPGLVLATTLLALAGCATSAETEPRPRGVAQFEGDPRLGEQVDKICFASNIDNFGNTTRDTFTVREGRDHFLIEIFGSCPPLEHAMTMRIDATMSCLRKGDHVIVSDSLIGGSDIPFSTERCLVNAIYKWDPKAKADDQDDSGDADEAEEES